jgi:hypothetical protein
MKEVTDELIGRTLAYAKGNKVRTAKILGVGRRMIYTRLEHKEGQDDWVKPTEWPPKIDHKSLTSLEIFGATRPIRLGFEPTTC